MSLGFRANIHRTNDGRFQASVTKGGNAYSIAIAADPVEALQEVLSRRPDLLGAIPADTPGGAAPLPVFIGLDLFE